MEFLFGLSISLICSSYFGYPMILFILAKLIGKEHKKADITPCVSILITAYNEEEVIAEKIENTLALDYPKGKLEIIIASESTDRTNQIVKTYKEKGIRLFTYPDREGQSFLIYKTLSHCQGEIIVFSDANASFKRDAVRKLVRNFADPEIGCVCGELSYVNCHSTSIGETEGLYRKYENSLKEQESKIQSVLGATGSIYALRKNLYSPLPKYPGADFELPIRVRQQGYGVILEREAFSFEQAPKKFWQEFRRKIRTTAISLRSAFWLLKTSFCLFQPILIFQLLFHKILRWLVPLFLILIFFSNLFLLEKFFYQLTMLFQIAFYGIAFFSWFQERQDKKPNLIFNFIYYFSIVNLAVLIGLIKGILGKQKPYWEKVR